MKQATTSRKARTSLIANIRSLLSRSGSGNLALTLSLTAMALPAAADITFTQSVDGWWYNEYTWNAQVESITRARSADLVGDVKNIWVQVVQKNGSEVGTEIYCTTMTKTGAGAFTDTWDVNVLAGTIIDKDFWDADRLGVKLVKCKRSSSYGMNSFPTHYGSLQGSDYATGELDENQNTRHVSIDPVNWDDQAVRDDGFDFAVYGYMNGPLPIILNHVDELGLTTFSYDQTDAFGTGQPYDPNQLVILGIDLDPSWDNLALQSNGLNFFNWQVIPNGGMLFTDQGNFQILRIEPIIPGWMIICPADLNQDGNIDVLDFFAFIGFFNAGDPAADLNGDGAIDVLDFFEFILDFQTGCP